MRRFGFGAGRHELEARLEVPRIPIPAAQRDAEIREVDEFLEKRGGAAEPWDRGAVPRDRGALLGIAGVVVATRGERREDADHPSCRR